MALSEGPARHEDGVHGEADEEEAKFPNCMPQVTMLLADDLFFKVYGLFGGNSITKEAVSKKLESFVKKNIFMQKIV